MSTPIQPEQPKKKGRGCLIAALIVLALFILLGVSMCAVVGKGVNDAMEAQHKVVYEVTGEGKVGDITYASDGQGSVAQAQGAKLPWTKEVTVKGAFAGVNVWAQNGLESGRGKITCRITVDGKEVAKNESSGQGAIASCNGSAAGGGQ